ncbi:disease resistance protein RUN1 [Rosa chinensis]|uniref:disease resistance protein RUN1 n=1 Tax=Rosa chinensis TaxID=74649 RepID=UPI000D09789F|nr:disease resistance protein RUN1 [Rosa chinensis]XP_040364233.1 disease resistance protein RUN1 [Rosa chinensis]XP_040364234.1 disease resistance protein RUN1 [Rosa chinensis]
MALVRSAHPEASSSSDASPSISSHDVFLSFRGEDTRKTFTDHLCTALMNAGFRTFRDDNDLQRGEYIKPELEKAIEQSRSSVIVFSKDYASSGWCLDELLMIMERRRTADHIVLPVFYDVDPSHVRKQTGSLAKAFAGHERNQFLKYKVKRWREALTEAADLSGMVLQNEADGHESKFIKKVVKVIEDRLRRTPLSVDRHLVGIDSQVEGINLWLEDESTDIFVLLVYGMRGIGKSTIAKYVYNLNCHRFERCSFLENIREVSERSNGLVDLQKRLLYDILSGKKVTIQGISEGIAKIEDAVSSRRVFLVLDDVDRVDHLDALLGMQNRFYPGNKIIITTSCAGLVEAHRQFVKVHEVKTLGDNDSLELFSRHAFGRTHPIESYVDLSVRVVDRCGGLPLALKVLGSSLSGKNLAFWGSYLNKLEVIPNDDILKKLKISYESLQDDHDRNLFLDIACFFIGMEKDFIVTILDDYDIFPEVGIQNLIDRCLVTIEYNNKVQMHNLIRDMGRGIVRRESKEPRNRSRLWHHKDSIEVLTENNGTEAIEGIVVNMQLHPTYTSPSRNASRVVLETNAFTRMHNLRFLQLSHVQLNGCYEEFPAGLRWLCWTKYPLASLPNEFPLERVVALEMCYSNLTKVWSGTKDIRSLKILNLSHSHDLTQTPDFSYIPNLERLDLRDCVSLIDVHESIGSLKRLVYLNVEDCTSIRRLPEKISFLVSLEVLIISGCSSLGEFPVDMRKMESLKVFQADGVPIQWFRVTTTREIELCPHPIQEISRAFPRNLVMLSLINCNLSDDDFPRDVANLLSLRKLDLSGNPISRLPDCIRGVTGLRDLSLSYCTKLKSLIRLPESLHFIVSGCTSLEKVTFQTFFRSGSGWGSNHNLVELQGEFKMEPIERVDKEMLKLLSLGNLETLENISMVNSGFYSQCIWKGTDPVQGLYEDGIFSTFLPGDEVPGQFSRRSRGSSVSFTVPLLPNLNIRGLNVFSIIAQSNNHDSDPMTNSVYIDGLGFPIITVVINKSKGLKWFHGPNFSGVPGEGKDVIWLSHWKFGNLLTCGDEVTILIYTKSEFKVKECGIQLVYYDEKDHVASTTDDLCFLRAGVRSTIPSGPTDRGITFLWSYGIGLGPTDENIVLIRDINEKSEKEEGQEGDLVLTLAAQSSSNSNKRGLIRRGWKGIMMATILILSLPLVTRSPLFHQRKKQ